MSACGSMSFLHYSPTHVVHSLSQSPYTYISSNVSPYSANAAEFGRLLRQHPELDHTQYGYKPTPPRDYWDY